MLQVLHLVNAQMEPTLNTKLGNFLAAKRRAAGWTQVELMKLLSSYGHSYAATTISGWENGRPMPVDNPAFVDALAMALEISAVEIYEAAGVFSATARSHAGGVQRAAGAGEAALGGSPARRARVAAGKPRHPLDPRTHAGESGAVCGAWGSAVPRAGRRDHRRRLMRRRSGVGRKWNSHA